MSPNLARPDMITNVFHKENSCQYNYEKLDVFICLPSVHRY